MPFYDSAGGETRMNLTVRILIIVASVGCQSGDPAKDATATTESSAVNACTWPTAYDVTDAGPAGECTAGRVLSRCKVTLGGTPNGTRVCLGTSTTECPGYPPQEGATYSDCENLCMDGEYALSCRRSSSASPPPAGCRVRFEPPGAVPDHVSRTADGTHRCA